MPDTASPQTPITRAQRQEALRLRAEGVTYNSIIARLGLDATPQRLRSAMLTEARRQGTAEQVLPRRAVRSDGRRFGIEIEFSHPDPYGAVAALRTAGLSVQDYEGWHHRVSQTQWKVVSDGSIYHGYEAVSPPLAGQDGFRQVRVAMRALRALGVSVPTSTGLHIHHDMDGLTGEAIARFVEAYATRQEHFDKLVAHSRRTTIQTDRYNEDLMGNEWCRPLQPWELELALGELRAYRRVPGSVDRYRTINVNAFLKYGTIEIRQHQGTLNARKAIAWIRLGQALIEAAAVQDAQVATDSLDNMLADLRTHGGLSERDRLYFLERAETLTRVTAD